MEFFDTPTMIAAVEQLTPATSFLRDRYFPTNDSTDLFATNDVLIEYKDGNRMVAPFVAPRKGGVTIHREGFEASRITPPNIAPQRTLTIDDLKKKGFGEALMSNLKPAEREATITLRDAAELGDMITRREELMAAEVMQTNACVMKHIADDKTKSDDREIKFYTGLSNPAEYTPTGNWEKAYDGIVKDLGAMVSTLAVRGLPATDLVVGADAADAILGNTEIQKLLDINNYNIGRVDPKTLPNGVSLIATLNIKGHPIDILLYEEQYEDFATGQLKPFIDPKNVILTAPGAGKTAYGAVTQLEKDGEFHTYANRRVPKYIPNVQGNTRSLVVTSCPVLMPVAKNPFVVAKVLS